MYALQILKQIKLKEVTCIVQHTAVAKAYWKQFDKSRSLQKF